MNPDVPAEAAGSEASVVNQGATAGATASADHRERAMAPPQSTTPGSPAKPREAPSAPPAAAAPAPAPEPEKIVPPAASVSTGGSPARGARKGWLIGVLAVVVVIVLAGAAFAYFKFVKPAPETAAADVAPASAASGAGAMPVAPMPATSSASMAGSGQSPPTAAVTANNASPAAPVMAAPAGTTEAPVAAQAAAVSPPVDRTLQMAADLVQKGEAAYARRDYRTAIRHAHSALDVHPGYADAEQLLNRAEAAQRRIAQQQARQEQAQEEARREAAAEAERAEAAAAAEQAARAKPVPTPDELYNQRAHSECARGFFGSVCRHKVREQVCAGVSLTAPGTSVCRDLKH
jgi:hypothetical protein